MLDNPIRDRQTERRTATRLEILNAAWTLARESGLAELTLRDVAERVGMRAPSLYSYFASKNEMYDAMFGQAWSELLRPSWKASSRPTLSPRGRRCGPWRVRSSTSPCRIWPATS